MPPKRPPRTLSSTTTPAVGARFGNYVYQHHTSANDILSTSAQMNCNEAQPKPPTRQGGGGGGLLPTYLNEGSAIRYKESKSIDEKMEGLPVGEGEGDVSGGSVKSSMHSCRNPGGDLVPVPLPRSRGLKLQPDPKYDDDEDVTEEIQVSENQGHEDGREFELEMDDKENLQKLVEKAKSCIQPPATSMIVPSELTLENCGDIYKGLLKIENVTSSFLAYKITSNKAAQGKYTATPNLHCIPPNSFEYLEIILHESLYPEFQNTGDKLVIHGYRSPRHLEKDELKTFLREMQQYFPVVGCKSKVELLVDPTLENGDSFLENVENLNMKRIEIQKLANEVSIWTHNLRETNLHLRQTLDECQNWVRFACSLIMFGIILLGIWWVYPLMICAEDKVPLTQSMPVPVKSGVGNFPRAFSIWDAWFAESFRSWL